MFEWDLWQVPMWETQNNLMGKNLDFSLMIHILRQTF